MGLLRTDRQCRERALTDCLRLLSTAVGLLWLHGVTNEKRGTALSVGLCSDVLF